MTRLFGPPLSDLGAAFIGMGLAFGLASAGHAIGQAIEYAALKWFEAFELRELREKTRQSE